MAERVTIDERMDQWLNDQADSNRIPDEYRAEFIARMRGTTAFAITRCSFAWDDVLEAERRVDRLAAWLRRPLWTR